MFLLGLLVGILLSGGVGYALYRYVLPRIPPVK
jgi:hypothetical protein